MSAVRRTVHACAQCRERKTKCGGITDIASCVACSSRNVRCSFDDEARDPRFNPYLRVKSRDRSARPEDTREHQTPELLSEVRRLRNELDELKAHRQPRSSRSPRDPAALYSLDGSDPSWGRRMDTSQTISPSLLVDTDHRYDPAFTNLDPVFDNFSRFQEGSFGKGNPALPASGSSKQRSRDSLDNVISSIPPVNRTSMPSSLEQTPPLPRALPDPPFSGPMRVLQDLGANDGFDLEVHDPIARQIITAGEASIAHRTFFEHCHINAPFLDPIHDADMASVRSRSMALMLNIIVAAARFWSHKSRHDTWLHPRYSKLVALLDAEMSRLTFRPRPADICLETVQAFMIYSHWMPIDVVTTFTGNVYRSRFSESSAWQCLGLATRWATLLGLDQTAHIPFLDESKTPTALEIESYRTMLYLTESDHYLALSARRPSTLSPVSVCQALPRFLSGSWAMATDARLASLVRVVEVSYVMGARADSEESVEAFNMDVNEIERPSENGTQDKMRQHFPFTSLRWYRLAFASTLLPSMSNWNNARQSIRLSVDWASQILYHLSSAATTTPFNPEAGTIQEPLQPDPNLVALLSFAIDQYYVVIAYTAAFLVLAWQNGVIDNELGTSLGNRSIPTESCALYRLVDLASRTLRQCAPARGHPATRYADFLAGMTKIINAEPITNAEGTTGQAALDTGDLMRDQDWLELWQDSGLDQNWLFGSIGDVP